MFSSPRTTIFLKYCNIRIDFIKNADRDMKLLSCADKLANIQDIIRDYDRLGDGVWGIFNASKDSVAWYYNSCRGRDSNL